MRLPRFSILKIFIHEVLSKRTLLREPEPALVMVDTDESVAYNEAGQASGALNALYVFISAHASLTLYKCKTVIDLGCGPGNQLIGFARLHPEISFCGLDLSEAMLELARKNAESAGVTNVTFKKMDISTLSEFAEGSVDGVFSSFAIHHLPTRQHLES